jgi:phosphomannomutase
MPNNKGSAVVYDVRSGHALAEEIRAAGGVALRERTGHASIKRTMTESQAVFGAELTGHFYFRDNAYADSGAIALARVLAVLSAQSNSLADLIRPLTRYSQSGEINFPMDEKDARIRELAERYKKARIDYLDGLTIDAGDWWFNLRKGTSDALLRLNVEARTPDLLQEKLAELRKVLGDPI